MPRWRDEFEREFGEVPRQVAPVKYSDVGDEGEVFSPPPSSNSLIRARQGATEPFSDLASGSVYEVFSPSWSRAVPVDDVRLERSQAPRSSSDRRVRVVPRSMSAIGVETPSVVDLCVRRRSRRQVIFAKRKHGGFHRKPRRTWRSDVEC